MLWHRITGVTKAAGILDGPHRCPKGPRHGYAVHAVGSGVPLNMLCRWMSHGSLKVTAIYADALGAEEQSIAAGMWGHRAKGTPFAASPFPAGPRTLA